MHLVKMEELEDIDEHCRKTMDKILELLTTDDKLTVRDQLGMLEGVKGFIQMRVMEETLKRAKKRGIK